MRTAFLVNENVTKEAYCPLQPLSVETLRCCGLQTACSAVSWEGLYSNLLKKTRGSGKLELHKYCRVNLQQAPKAFEVA